MLYGYEYRCALHFITSKAVVGLTTLLRLISKVFSVFFYVYKIMSQTNCSLCLISKVA